MKTSAADLGDLCSWSWWPLIVTSNGGNPNNLYLSLHDIAFWKLQTKDIAMVTFAADLGDHQTKPNNTYLPLHDIPFWKRLFDFIASLRSHKSVAEVTFVMSLVWCFQKGLSCRVKYALFGLVWFGGHPNQLQRSPLQCPWSGVFKKVYHVGVNMHFLVWFGLEVNLISCRGQHCNILGLAFSKRYIM